VESGSIFGRFTDAEVYSRILESDFKCFADLSVELAAVFLQHGIEYVAGDACEGYNPAHDLCRLILNAAVGIVQRCTDRRILNFDFPLSGRPDHCHQSLLAEAIRIDLDDVSFKRKLSVAQNYPELLHEVAKTVRRNGVDAFRKECLRPVYSSEEPYLLEDPPFYEQYGEFQVAAGLYDRVLRYRRHMLPLAEALRRHLEQMDEL
jgi:hypothetical protein